MTGWEVAVAAFGGLLLGVGIGLLLGRSQERSLSRRLTQLESRLRSTVVPVLERRAEMVGLPVHRRAPASRDGIELVTELAEAIRSFEQGEELPYTDTLEAAPRSHAPTAEEGNRER